MRTIGLEGVRLRRRHRTTVADPAAAKAPDLIGRDFTAAAVNTKYVGDITYLPVSGAKPLYLATVIDLCSRRLAGWAIADHMRTDLVIDALAAAERTRGGLAGAVMHTDHGSRYTSRAFAEICRSAGVRQSMGAVGSSADNAAAESFNAAFKRECRRTDLDPQSRTFLRPQLSGHFGLSLDGLEAVLEPVAGAVDRDDFAVVQEAVEDRGGQDFVAEDLAPFAEGLVRSEDDRALLVALGDHLEDQVRLGAFKRLVLGRGQDAVHCFQCRFSRPRPPNPPCELAPQRALHVIRWIRRGTH